MATLKELNVKSGDVVRDNVGEMTFTVDRVGEEDAYGRTEYEDGDVVEDDFWLLDCINTWELVSRTGTLAELGVKIGDVVECVDNTGVPRSYTVGNQYTVGGNDNLDWKIEPDEGYGKFRIVTQSTQPNQDLLQDACDRIIQQYRERIDNHLEEGDTAKAASLFLEMFEFTRKIASE